MNESIETIMKDCWEGGRAQTVKQYKVQKGDWDKVQEYILYYNICLHYLSSLKIVAINSKGDDRVFVMLLITSSLWFFRERPCNKLFMI